MKFKKVKKTMEKFKDKLKRGLLFATMPLLLSCSSEIIKKNAAPRSTAYVASEQRELGSETYAFETRAYSPPNRYGLGH